MSSEDRSFVPLVTTVDEQAVQEGDVYRAADTGRLWWVSEIDVLDEIPIVVEAGTGRQRPLSSVGAVTRVYRHGDERVITQAAAKLRALAEGGMADVSTAIVEDELAALADRLDQLTGRIA